MKKVIFALSCLLAVGFTTISCRDDDNDDETTISTSQLPDRARDFIKIHFANSSIVRAEKSPEQDYSDGSIYEVKLNNGFEIEFTKEGEWAEISGNGNTFPNSIIALLPISANEFILEKHPNAQIREINKRYTGYFIELQSRLTLHFNVKGEFLGYH